MVLKTSGAPKRMEEVFDSKDRSEIHRMITELRQTYLARHSEALADYHQVQREANRKLHEVNRVQRHLKRIEVFCQANDIPLDNVLNEE